MNAGKLRHRITVDEPMTTIEPNGEEIVTFETVDTVWGSIEPLTGRELLQENAIMGAMDTRFRLRWSPKIDAINAKWRLTHRGVLYNIKSIAHLQIGRREVEIMAQSGLNAG